MKTLEIGKTYSTRCFGDYELIETWTIIKKTAKRVTGRSSYGEVKTVQLRTSADGEFAIFQKGFTFVRAERGTV